MQKLILKQMRGKANKFLITTETHEVFVVRGAGKKIPAFCPDCEREAEMLGLDSAVAASGLRAREIFSLAESGGIHFIETEAGHLLLCKNSILMQRKTEKPMNENTTNNEKTSKLTRREALGTIGTVLAATAAIGLASQSAKAQAANFEFVVTKYRAYIYSAFTQESLIMVGDAAGRWAMLNFRKDGQALSANSLSPNQMLAQVYFPQSRFDEIRDFLRYEKPVRFTLTSANIASLSTDSDELIGDHDI